MVEPNVVPGSDGAGVVISVGKSVLSHAPGDKVVTHLVPNIAASRFPTAVDISAGLGQAADGTIREYGVFHENTLVHMPTNLSFEQAATLTCSGLTAWNALYGGGSGPKKGDTILTQGTGGVSIAAVQVRFSYHESISYDLRLNDVSLQFAYAAGATVISTTSSDEKAARLTALGASHTINYRADKQWGMTARSLTANSTGVTNIVDVGGMSTLAQSFQAVCVDGVVSLTGILGDEADEKPSVMDCLWRVCSARGLFLGTRNQFNDMVKFIEEKGIEPVVDDKIFNMDEVKEAFEWLEKQKHFSKVVIRIA